MQAYSDPKREGDPHSLPDIEVFFMLPEEDYKDEDGNPYEPGYYYWFCFPGCLPDSGPIGPYATEAEALEDARDDWNDPDCD